MSDPKASAASSDEERMVPIQWLKNAFAMRAAAYANVFDVLRETYGTDQAVKLLAEATRRMGVTMGANYADLAPGDLPGLRDRFLGGIPAGDVMFKPEVRQCDDEKLDIQFHRCPLKEAWQAMGRNEEDLELLCKAGATIDNGLFGAAGFTFNSETWKPGQEGCCHLMITPGPEHA